MASILADQEVLLVLDNCEHLLDEVTDLVDVALSRGRGPRVLATSREALGAPGERVIRVPSLPVEPEGGLWSPAVRLLLDRHRAQPADVRGDDVQVMHDICRRLDGIPSAIELAAAQLDALSPATCSIGSMNGSICVGGHGRRRQRQQTLQAMMDRSWELLDASERPLLAVLAVFAGPGRSRQPSRSASRSWQDR